jgi:hypothetical protein
MTSRNFRSTSSMRPAGNGGARAAADQLRRYQRDVIRSMGRAYTRKPTPSCGAFSRQPRANWRGSSAIHHYYTSSSRRHSPMPCSGCRPSLTSCGNSRSQDAIHAQTFDCRGDRWRCRCEPFCPVGLQRLQRQLELLGVARQLLRRPAKLGSSITGQLRQTKANHLRIGRGRIRPPLRLLPHSGGQQLAVLGDANQRDAARVRLRLQSSEKDRTLDRIIVGETP